MFIVDHQAVKAQVDSEQTLLYARLYCLPQLSLAMQFAASLPCIRL